MLFSMLCQTHLLLLCTGIPHICYLVISTVWLRTHFKQDVYLDIGSDDVYLTAVMLVCMYQTVTITFPEAISSVLNMDCYSYLFIWECTFYVST